MIDSAWLRYLVTSLAGRCLMQRVGPGRRSGGQGTARSGIDPSGFDRAVRPQDDFFRYVNGGWIARVEIPADRALYGSFVELLEKSEADLRAIIEEAAARTDEAAGLGSSQDRRPLRQLHGRGPRQPAGPQAHRAGPRADRRDSRQGRPDAHPGGSSARGGHRPLRRLRHHRRQAVRPVHPLSQPGRPWPAR